ncbi:MAG: hypothetical protein ACK5TM_00415 [Methylobacterium sp.]|jgi:hypothetical protein|nr:hypothetical protein [Hyphomonadaceae bacterium]
MNSLPDVISAPRFATYKQWASGNEDIALRLYTYNVQLSAALYGPLHIFEVSLRNSIDSALVSKFGISWPDDHAVGLSLYQIDCIAAARKTLAKENKAGTHPQLVAELNLGFWTSFLGRQSHHLWQWLRPVFQTRGLQRHQLAAQLKDVRTLRNRVAHYEPILALPLAQRYAEVTTLTGWLSSAAAAWINRHSSWQSIYPAVPILTTDPTTKITRMDPAVLPYLPPV